MNLLRLFLTFSLVFLVSRLKFCLPVYDGLGERSMVICQEHLSAAFCFFWNLCLLKCFGLSHPTKSPCVCSLRIQENSHYSEYLLKIRVENVFNVEDVN